MTAGIAVGRLCLPEGRIKEVALRVLEVRMVEYVKEVGIESQLRTLRNPERLAHPEVEINKLWTGDRAATQVRVAPPASMNVSRAGKDILKTEGILVGRAWCSSLSGDVIYDPRKLRRI